MSSDKNRLIELLEDTLHEWECDVQTETLSQIADHLLANGVKLSAELQNKCGSCVYAKPIVAFGKSKCYVQCTNREHIERFCTREISTLRQRTNPACKNHQPQAEQALAERSGGNA